MRKRVVVTGLGCLTANSVSVTQFWAALQDGRSSIAALTRFDTVAYKSKIGAEISHDLAALSGLNLANISRNAQFALCAAQEALRDSGIIEAELPAAAIGICLGTGLGGLYFSEEALLRLLEKGPERVSPLTVPSVDPNVIVNQIAMRWGISGQQFSISSACSSSGHALGAALDMIRAGRAQAVISGGVEATISPAIFSGFDKLRAMSTRNDTPETACRPFSADRDGFVMAEGAAILVLEEEASARARGANIYAELLGYGASGGGYHAVMPQPNGLDAAQAMQLALADAGICASQIDLINPHGTATKLNDDAELKAMQAVFGTRLADIHMTPTKQLTGHLLGAAAAIEALHVVKSLETSSVTAIPHFDRSVDLKIASAASHAAPIRYAMSNSFGFGNNNVSLIFGVYE